jgi:hypothetical protein
MASLAEFAASTVSPHLPDIAKRHQCQKTSSHMMTPWIQPQRPPVRLCPVLLCTESDGSSVHTPDTTCAFRHGTPDAFTINDSNAEAFAALSRCAVHQEDDTRIGVTWPNWVCLAALGPLTKMPRHGNSPMCLPSVPKPFTKSPNLNAIIAGAGVGFHTV